MKNKRFNKTCTKCLSRSLLDSIGILFHPQPSLPFFFATAQGQAFSASSPHLYEAPQQTATPRCVRCGKQKTHNYALVFLCVFLCVFITSNKNKTKYLTQGASKRRGKLKIFHKVCSLKRINSMFAEERLLVFLLLFRVALLILVVVLAFCLQTSRVFCCSCCLRSSSFFWEAVSRASNFRNAFLCFLRLPGQSPAAGWSSHSCEGRKHPHRPQNHWFGHGRRWSRTLRWLLGGFSPHVSLPRALVQRSGTLYFCI